MSQGAQILDQTRSFLSRFVFFPSQAALDVTTLWVAATHVRDPRTEELVLQTSPRIAFLSDLPASGKTAALEMAGRLAARGQQVIDPTPATYAIMNAQQRATILIDEVDVLFGAGGAKSTLRSLANGGYKAGNSWQRSNGDSLSIFGPLAMAGLGRRFRTADALSALRSRTLMIEMQPKGSSSEIETYRERLHGPMSVHVRNTLSSWCRRNAGQISMVFPDFPEVSNRTLELAEPLLQIADHAQGHWPETARHALREILCGTLQDTETAPESETPLSEMLLSDLRTVFATRDAQKLSTATILEDLYALPESPWKALWPSQAAAPRELAQLLDSVGVDPCKIRVGEQSLRGYRVWDLPQANDVPDGAGVPAEHFEDEDAA